MPTPISPTNDRLMAEVDAILALAEAGLLNTHAAEGAEAPLPAITQRNSVATGEAPMSAPLDAVDHAGDHQRAAEAPAKPGAKVRPTAASQRSAKAAAKKGPTARSQPRKPSKTPGGPGRPRKAEGEPVRRNSTGVDPREEARLLNLVQRAGDHRRGAEIEHKESVNSLHEAAQEVWPVACRWRR
jgi:hypothetical protein